MSNMAMALMGIHNACLALLSVMIVAIASYIALDLAGWVTVAQGRVGYLRLAKGAIAMGVGIWSVRFIAMLAYHLSVLTACDIPVILISMAVAVLVSGVALFTVNRQSMSELQLLGEGIFDRAGNCCDALSRHKGDAARGDCPL